MFLYVLFLVVGFSSGEEEQCSKYHYEEKTLEKVIRMGIRMEEMQRTLDKLEVNFAEINTSVTEQLITDTETKTIAFFATSLEHLNYGANQKLEFKNVVTNLGDAYDPTCGTFTTPTSGTYVFFSTVLGMNDIELWNCIAVNETEVARFNSHGTEGRHDDGTATVVVQLNKGDAVSVKNIYQNGNTHGGSYTNFGGFRLGS